MGRRVTRGSLRIIVERARRYAGDGMVRGKGWTLAQVCDHLARTVANTVSGSAADGLPEPYRRLNRWGRVQRWAFKHYMMRRAWFPEGVTAPDRVRPADDISIEVALAKLEAAVEAFEEKCLRRGATWSGHTYLGRFSGRGWRRFHHVHAAHHFAFLRKA